MPCRLGYQSHYTTFKTPSGKVAGELAIFDASLAIPLFTWIPPRQAQTAPAAPKKAAPAAPPVTRKEWTFELDRNWQRKPRPLLQQPIFFFFFSSKKTKQQNKQTNKHLIVDLSKTPAFSLGQPKWWRNPMVAMMLNFFPPLNADPLVPIFENGQVLKANDPLDTFSKLSQILPLLGERIDVVEKAYFINNDRLMTQFEGYLDSLQVKQWVNPVEFNKKDWNISTDPEVARKREFNPKLETLCSQTDKIMSLPGVVPMVQGTRENAAHRIAKNGLGRCHPLT
jgi:hypothetical protein